MGDVGIVKASYHMDDGIGGTDVAEELVAQALALACALDKTGNIHELDDSRSVLLGLVEISQPVQPLIGYGYHAHVGVNGAECIVVRRYTCVGDCVEQSGLAHIGQSYDTELHIVSFSFKSPLFARVFGFQLWGNTPFLRHFNIKSRPNSV